LYALQHCNLVSDIRSQLHKDRENDADITSDEDIDCSIRICLFEAHGLQRGLVIPAVSALFRAIQRLLEQTNSVLWVANSKALWLLHIDVTVHFAVQIGIEDANSAQAADFHSAASVLRMTSDNNLGWAEFTAKHSSAWAVSASSLSELSASSTCDRLSFHQSQGLW